MQRDVAARVRRGECISGERRQWLGVAQDTADRCLKLLRQHRATIRRSADLNAVLRGTRKVPSSLLSHTGEPQAISAAMLQSRPFGSSRPLKK
jgi:hypothetical protein